MVGATIPDFLQDEREVCRMTAVSGKSLPAALEQALASNQLATEEIQTITILTNLARFNRFKVGPSLPNSLNSPCYENKSLLKDLLDDKQHLAYFTHS